MINYFKYKLKPFWKVTREVVHKIGTSKQANQFSSVNIFYSLSFLANYQANTSYKDFTLDGL
jgi:hypothetical protein